MNYLIVDLECTCWERNPPAPHETIEIGAALCDSNGRVIDEYQAFVRPAQQPILSEFCRRLTAIEQSDVENAPAFPEAFSAFVAWARSHAPCLPSSWGAFDRKQLREECRRHGLDFPFAEHCNLKQAFAAANNIRPCGMAGALRLLELPLVGTHRRGIDDARNIARLLGRLLEAAPDQLRAATTHEQTH